MTWQSLHSFDQFLPGGPGVPVHGKAPEGLLQGAELLGGGGGRPFAGTFRLQRQPLGRSVLCRVPWGLGGGVLLAALALLSATLLGEEGEKAVTALPQSRTQGRRLAARVTVGTQDGAGPSGTKG